MIVEQAMAEMKGQSDPTVISKEPEVKVIDETPTPTAETPAPQQETPAPAAETVTPIKEEHAADYGAVVFYFLSLLIARSELIVFTDSLVIKPNTVNPWIYPVPSRASKKHSNNSKSSSSC